MITAALLGNPNSGKSTLFNALTNSHQKTANWSGVTVDSVCKARDAKLSVIDLPGCYSICHADTSGAPDEILAAEFLFKNPVDLIINIVDATNLTRSLYLTTQLAELGIHMIIILSKIDLIKNHVQIHALQRCLADRPIITCNGLDVLQISKTIRHIDQTIETYQSIPLTRLVTHNKLTEQFIQKASSILKRSKYKQPLKPTSLAIQLLSSDEILRSLPTESQHDLQTVKKNIWPDGIEDIDITIAQSRYHFIHQILAQCRCQSGIQKPSVHPALQHIDTLSTKPLSGLCIMLLAMYSLFFLVANIGGSFQTCLTEIGTLCLVDLPNTLLHTIQAPHFLQLFLVQGLGQGSTTLLSFIPIIYLLFFGLGFLEDSGYLPRAAVVADKLMRLIQLPGKAFIPLIIGFSCNVPAILATRTLESYRDRLLTSIMAPFMLCNARLAVFAIFAQTFFPQHASFVILSLYLSGIFIAILTGLILCRFIIPGNIQPLVMELPPYQLPQLRKMHKYAYFQTQQFTIRVGKYILVISGLISIMISINIQGGSLLERIGQIITPLCHPIGITQNNWPATVSILTGFIAKENIIITLSQLYHHLGSLDLITIHAFTNHALSTIQHAFSAFIPWLATDQTTSGLSHSLAQYFTTQSALAYMVFNLLYIPCVSTIATLAKETNWYWAAFSIAWSCSLAYTIAMLIAQWNNNYIYDMLLLSITTTILISNLLWAKHLSKKDRRIPQHELTTN